MATHERGLLILVEGDDLSTRILEASKMAQFEGSVLTLSPERAAEQGPLPALLVGSGSYGPSLIEAYFDHLRKYR